MRSKIATWAACLALVSVVGTSHAQEGTHAKLKWDAGALVVLDASAGEAVGQVVALVNASQFDEALSRIAKGGSDIPPDMAAELAMAVAGHLDLFDPKSALADARAYLDIAARGDPGDTRVLWLTNQLDLFANAPSYGLPTDPFLLPARDLIAEGKVEEGRKKMASREQTDRRACIAWVLAATFEGRDDLAVLYDDADKGLQEIDAKELLRLLHLSREHDWASLSVSPDCVLYPRVLLERMRAYYWWWRQMGEKYRPMSKQGFFEILGELAPLFPDSDLIRMYQGEKVPWGEGFRPDPIPEGAPGWAVNQRELRARVDAVVEWWFTHRQAPNGELGGGWEDDCETLRRWSVTALCCDNQAIRDGITRLVDGIWSSGELVNGYDRVFKDVEHSSEMAADTSIMPALVYGDPLYVEHAMETAKTTADVHTAINEHGHRHYRAMKMSATEVAKDDRQTVDAQYCGRAMRSAAMLAWYSGNPAAIDLVSEWARAWSEDMARAGATKPAGVMPATIGFSDDNVDGRGKTWWDPGLNDLYDWRPVRQDMVLGKILGVWDITRDDALLKGPRAQFDLMLRTLANPPSEPAKGSAEWAGSALLSETTRIVGMYRAYTGDTYYDELLKARGAGYERFLATGDPRDVEAAHSNDLNSMRFNFPMLTSEVRGTDRVDLRPASLLGPLTGSPVSVTEPPCFAVTWRRVTPDFTALVRRHDNTGLSAWVYSFADRRLTPEAVFWRLEPGRYDLTVCEDRNGDGESDDAPIHSSSFEFRERTDSELFALPPKVLCLMTVTQIEKGPARPARMPDIAVMPRDIVAKGPLKVGQPGVITVTVHNIGAADAEGVTVNLTPVEGGVFPQLREDGEDDSVPFPGAFPRPLTARLDTLAFPGDLVPKRATLEFAWTPQKAGKWEFLVSIRHSADADINYRNDLTSTTLTVLE